ncbi:MAG: pirin family protein [Pirellulales bacterium]
MKKLEQVVRNVPGHWVGDGFPVRSMFSYHSPVPVSPFLLLDYGGPAEFEPSPEPRGVDEHPHRGFETVTIVFQGELQHRDSGGHSGAIGPGDVQWMTAASGVVHEEKHSDAFTRRGGAFEVAQLWVNLPAAEKMSRPRYQEILAAQIPTAELPGGAGTARVIAGGMQGVQGPAKTVTPVALWDLTLAANHRAALPVPAGYTAILLVRNGLVEAGGQQATNAELMIFDTAGENVELTAQRDTKALLLAGLPIDEPVVGSGPFVMNTREEIRQAIEDYQAGRMGTLS